MPRLRSSFRPLANDLRNQRSKFYCPTQNRAPAPTDDLNVAIDKTPVSAQAYFHYPRADEFPDEEMEVAPGDAIKQDRTGRRFKVCPAGRLSKGIRTVIV